MELEFETRTTDYLRQSIEGVCRQEQTLEVIVPDAIRCAFQTVSPSDCSGWFHSCGYSPYF